MNVKNIDFKSKKTRLIIGGIATSIIILSFGLGFGLNEINNESNNETKIDSFQISVDRYKEEIVKVSKETTGDERERILKENEFELIKKYGVYCGQSTIEEAQTKADEIFTDALNSYSYYYVPNIKIGDERKLTTFTKYKDSENIELNCWKADIEIPTPSSGEISDEELNKFIPIFNRIRSDQEKNKITTEEVENYYHNLITKTHLFCDSSSSHPSISSYAPTFRKGIKNPLGVRTSTNDRFFSRIVESRIYLDNDFYGGTGSCTRLLHPDFEDNYYYLNYFKTLPIKGNYKDATNNISFTEVLISEPTKSVREPLYVFKLEKGKSLESLTLRFTDGAANTANSNFTLYEMSINIKRESDGSIKIEPTDNAKLISQVFPTGSNFRTANLTFQKVSKTVSQPTFSTEFIQMYKDNKNSVFVDRYVPFECNRFSEGCPSYLTS